MLKHSREIQLNATLHQICRESQKSTEVALFPLHQKIVIGQHMATQKVKGQSSRENGLGVNPNCIHISDIAGLTVVPIFYPQ